MNKEFDKDDFIKRTREMFDKIEKLENELPFYTKWFINLKFFIIYEVIARIKDLPLIFKNKFQRLTRGYSDLDVMLVGDFVFEKTYKPLKKFIKHYEEHGMALPLEFATDPGTWLSILKKIEFAFDSEWSVQNEIENRFTKGMTDEKIKEHDKKVEEGFTLFGKYLLYLYD